MTNGRRRGDISSGQKGGSLFFKRGGKVPRINAVKEGPVVFSKQKQAGHTLGTPQYKNRVKQKTKTSAFFGDKSRKRLTEIAYNKVDGHASREEIIDYDFGFSLGIGPNGGMQTRVRVHIDEKGRIHGHPHGPERF